MSLSSLQPRLSDRVRALLLLPIAPGERALTPAVVLRAFALMFLLFLFVEWLFAGAEWSFQLYGINSMLASCALALGLAALFSTRGTGQALLFLVMDIALVMSLMIGVGERISTQASGWLSILADSMLLLFPVALVVWTALAARRILRADSSLAAPSRRAWAFALCLWGVMAALPHWPVFEGGDFKRSTANLWELGATLLTRPDDSVAAAHRNVSEERRVEIELAQPALLDAAMQRLAPREAGKANVFLLGVAGWGSQQIFTRDLDAALMHLGKRFGAQARTVRLANNDRDRESQPLASVQNLASVLRGLAARMDTERDLLVLAMTSHGSTQGFALENGNLVSRLLHPQALATMLDQAGIRNRVVIVSSCYSGTFLAPLANENSVVISASAADKVSFGCTDEREMTFFGEAFYTRGLAGGNSLVEAFWAARGVISEWEEDQKLGASEPQLHVGAAVQARFPDIVGAPASRRASR